MRSRLSMAAGALSVVVGVSTLLGWRYGVDWLTNWGAGLVTMKLATAEGFILAGLARLSKGAGARRLGDTLAACLLLIGCAYLSVYHEPAPLPHEVVDSVEVDGIWSVIPQRPSAMTLVAFVSVALAELFGWRRAGFAAALVAVPPLAGYALLAFGVEVPVLWYYVEGVSTAMALPTATLFMALGLTAAVTPPAVSVPVSG